MVDTIPGQTNGRPAELIYINAADAYKNNTTYYDDISVTLPRPVSSESGYSLFVSLYALSLPITQGSISPYNNVLTINATTVTFEPGNYSASTLQAALQLGFPAITVAFNSTTSKMSFTSPTSMTISGSMCAPLNITEGSSGTMLSSNFNVDLTGIRSINVVTNLIGNAIDCSSTGNRGLLAQVQQIVPSGGVLQFSDYDGRQGIVSSDRGIHELRIRLLDSSGRPVLASLPFTAVLRVTRVYTGAFRLQIDVPSSLAVPPPARLKSRK